ncbi:MAG: hypothetical protein PHD97_04035 [Bacteroidales bacterium]|nr:hypothetical protein [Bacteroidales bacterium]
MKNFFVYLSAFLILIILALLIWIKKCNNEFQIVKLQPLLVKNYPNQKDEIKEIFNDFLKPEFLKSEPEETKNELYDFFLSNKNKDIDKWHNYFRAYYEHFKKFKDSAVNILEIGVERGGSLKMWKSFFGKDSKIFGIDIDPQCAKHSGKDITVIIGDQTDIKLLKNVNSKYGPFDIIIDDGGHIASLQIISFITLFPLLKENGIYVCEDTHTSYWEGYKDITNEYTFMNFSKYLVDLTNQVHFSDCKNIGVSFFSANCEYMHFYDSMVFFKKKKRKTPAHERR